MLSLALGAGVAALLESTDETIRGRLDVMQLLQSPPLAIVPRITTAQDRRVAQRRRQLTLGATAAAGVAAVLVTHFLVKPLDVLWFAALRHLGL